MLFTIAIPVYNGEKSVEKTIISCINQTYNEEYEILIVDNNSTDNTKNILKKYENNRKIKILSNKNTVSMYENHNICIKEASGDYIIFCHSDDKLTNNSLSILKVKLKQRNYPDKYVCWGRSYYRDTTEVLYKHNLYHNQMFSGDKAAVFFSNWSLTPSGTMFSRMSFYKVGGFLFCNQYISYAADYSTMIFLAIKIFSFEMVDKYLFERKYASTANGNYNYELNRFNALECLYDKSNKNELIFLLNVLLRNNRNSLKLIEKYLLCKLPINVKFILIYIINRAKIKRYIIRDLFFFLKRTVKIKNSCI